jgi:hypothetical protein
VLFLLDGLVFCSVGGSLAVDSLTQLDSEICEHLLIPLTFSDYAQVSLCVLLFEPAEIDHQSDYLFPLLLIPLWEYHVLQIEWDVLA